MTAKRQKSMVIGRKLLFTPKGGVAQPAVFQALTRVATARDPKSLRELEEESSAW